MDIGSIAKTVGFPMEIQSLGGEEMGGIGFSELLGQSLQDVNELIKKSDEASKGLAIGKTENLHEAMIGFEKAESAMKLLMQVRTRALEAYNQIIQMQV